jgi:hypothetical protein
MPRSHFTFIDFFQHAGAATYLGTLKTAIRLRPRLNVASNVPMNPRSRPFSITSFHPERVVILPPFLTFFPRTLIFAAMIGFLRRLILLVARGEAKRQALR